MALPLPQQHPHQESSPASLSLAQSIHNKAIHNLACHETLQPHLNDVAEQLMFYAIATGWVLDPTGKYLLNLEWVADGLQKKGKGPHSIHVQAV